jgi:hypothetical protein
MFFLVVLEHIWGNLALGVVVRTVGSLLFVSLLILLWVLLVSLLLLLLHLLNLLMSRKHTLNIIA